MLRVSNLKWYPGENEDALRARAAKALGIKADDIRSFSVSKKSVDARDKSRVHFVCAVDVAAANEGAALKNAKPGSVKALEKEEGLHIPRVSSSSRPVVVGLGPCGLFSALYLARAGLCPIVLERGDSVEERARRVSLMAAEGVLDEESNVQFGEGGAGAFSDGKLTTGIKDPLCRWVLRELYEHGAPEEILILQRPHIGTDKLPRVVAAIRSEIEGLGGTVLFRTRVEKIHAEKGRLRAVTVARDGTIGEMPVERMILATGHSARDTYEALYEAGVEMTQKPFSIGVRIEQSQREIDRAQYGGFAGRPELPAAEYHLSCRASSGRGVYTFCMCPGGTVVAAASEKERLCTNGMSVFLRNGANANSGLLVDVRTEDYASPHPLAGLAFQRKWEEQAYLLGGGGYIAPAQLAGDFLQNAPSSAAGGVMPSYLPGVRFGKIDEALPRFAVEALREGLVLLDRRLHGFAAPDAVLTAAETRSSSPVRILRGEDGQASLKGLYPAGEGAGQAGGIMSSAVDGLRAAKKLADNLGAAENLPRE